MDAKKRMIMFNNISLREKQVIIKQLVYLVYYVLYALCLSFLHNIKLISTKVFILLLVIGLLVVIILIYSVTSRPKEFKEDTIIRKVLNVPNIRCPSECTPKK